MDIEAKAASCRACGAANKATAKFCRQCGLPLGADATAHGAEAAAPAEPASPPASRQDVSLTAGDSVPAGGAVSTASTEVPATRRPGSGGMRPSPAVLVAAVFAIAVAGVLLYTTSRDKAAAPEQAAAPSAPAVAERGSLQVDVNVPARATLDGWHLPDAGAKPASGIVFSDVEATTHTLEVWSEGYRRDTSNVAVRPGQTTKVTVTLQRAEASIGGVYPHASQRLLSPDDVNGLSKQDLKIMRNEVFARHGYIFKTPDMREYFSAQPWYRGQYDDVASMLSGIERQNVEFIIRYE